MVLIGCWHACYKEECTLGCCFLHTRYRVFGVAFGVCTSSWLMFTLVDSIVDDRKCTVYLLSGNDNDG